MSTKKTEKPETPAINWKLAADRSIYGERRELASLPGFWIQPRKLSKTGQAEVTAVLARQQMRKASVRKAIMAEAAPVQKSELAAMSGEMSADTQARLMDAVAESLTAGELSGLDTKVVEIAYGIHAHNFAGEPQGGTLEWARELVEYPDVFDEVYAIVQEKNLPLASKTPSSSET
jgi:hypothetical protein